MLYQPDLIVYLWLLPVVIFIITPGLLKTSCILYKMTSKGQVACEREYARQNSTVLSRDRRKYPRGDLTGVIAQVVGINGYCSATVANVSSIGLCLKSLPHALLNEANKFKIIVSTHIDNFEIEINPRWEKLPESGYLVGAEIDDPPRGWHEFIGKMNRVAGGAVK